MIVTDLIDHLQGVRRNGSGYSAKCPSHEDKNPSLSISEGNDGRILLKCQAGCSTEAVCGALGIKLADLFPPKQNGSQRRIVATYDYIDEIGKLLFQVVRLDPKDFRQRRPDSTAMDGWAWNLKGVQRVPFHLPQVIKAVAAGRPIYIAEGEKDVLALEKAGFAATCNPGGAGKWQPEFGKYLQGAEVIVIADKDVPGRKHAADVVSKLKEHTANIKVIECPDLNGHAVKDAADYFAAGGQAADLDELTRTAPKPKVDIYWFDLVEDGSDLQVRDIPPVVEIVEGIVAEYSKLSIVSSAKCFKTWLTINLAIAISAGADFLGRNTNRRRVLYVNLELKPQTFTRRLQAIAKALGITIDPKWFSHLSLRGKLSGLTVAEIVTRIIKIAGELQAEVIIVDPLFKLNVEGEENSSRDQTVFCNELDRLTTEAKATAIFNDHSGKGNQSEKDPLDVIRGSSAKGGDLDAAMVLRKHEIQGCFSVDLVHRELAPVAPFVIEWGYPLMRLRDDLDAANMKRLKPGAKPKHDPEQLCAAIVEHHKDNPVSVSQWAAKANLPRQTLCNYLPGLRAKRWIGTAGEGNSARQYLTDAGLDAAKRYLEAA